MINQNKMKLYTEKQVIRMMELARFTYNSEDKIILSQTPIELPNDEEVEQYLKSFPYTKHLDDGQYNDGVIVGAELAIEWMRSKLLTFKSE